MKRLFFILVAVLITAGAMAVESQQFSQNPSAIYRLYPTQNMYIYLRLDTRYGQIDMVQWSTDPANRVYTTLSDKNLLPSGQDVKAGRFTLYSTTNIYNFILLDQNNGNMWQVQWSIEPINRMVVPINKI
jgi:hypothetical protein